MLWQALTSGGAQAGCPESMGMGCPATHPLRSLGLAALPAWAGVTTGWWGAWL